MSKLLDPYIICRKMKNGGKEQVTLDLQRSIFEQISEAELIGVRKKINDDTGLFLLVTCLYHCKEEVCYCRTSTKCNQNLHISEFGLKA